MELNAEQIKKALELCSNNDECVGEACPYYKTGCEKNMPKDALALVNSQEQRIKDLEIDLKAMRGAANAYKKHIVELSEELQKLKKVKYIFSTVDYCADDLATALEENKKLTEENERLRAENARYEAENHAEFNKWLKLEEATKRHHSELFEEAKTAVKEDTVRKMQERLTLEFERMHKSNFMTPEVRQWIIDQIAKEMLEDKPCT